MESAINVLVAQFKTYAAKDGSSHTLSKEEFQTLVVSQLPNLVKYLDQLSGGRQKATVQLFQQRELYINSQKNASDPAVINQLMSSLDENNDGELTFQEFWQLIGKLASTHGGFSQ